MVHWPGDPPARITRTLDMARGNACTVSFLAMTAHTGTHMDAPSHFIRGGRSLDFMPAAAGVGVARVIPIRSAAAVTVRELLTHRLRHGERILFKTRNSRRCWTSDRFIKDFVYISADAARYLAERRVRTVGVDYLSVGGFSRDARETHEALLGAGIWIIEGLNLSGVRPGPVDLMCLPLRLPGADGAPARALVRVRRR